KAIELDTNKQILGAVMSQDELASMAPDEITAYYENHIASMVVDSNADEGTEVEGTLVNAEYVDIGSRYTRAPENRLYPVFMYHEEANAENVSAYILPLYGAGLWNAIWGYLALQSDLNTIEGVTFAHAGETPGLGARITEEGVQQR